MRLLVVDDDPSVREALELVLDLNGFGVATAADGKEAIRALAIAAPDAVILDVLMPGLDGLEVCRRMRAIGDRTPVLMLSARAEVSERVAGLEAGADDYLVKPFASEELVGLSSSTGGEPASSKARQSGRSRRTRPPAAAILAPRDEGKEGKTPASRRVPRRAPRGSRRRWSERLRGVRLRGAGRAPYAASASGGGGPEPPPPPPPPPAAASASCFFWR
jgi:CheY-like chemotaxis protein